MKRLITAALVAGAVLLATASAAFADSHTGATPTSLNLWDTVKWQFEDFVAHMSLTLEAIKLMLVSPSLGWAILDGVICGDKTHWAHALFDTADHALENFFSIIGILALLGIEVAIRIRAFIAGLMRRPTQALA